MSNWTPAAIARLSRPRHASAPAGTSVPEAAGEAATRRKTTTEIVFPGKVPGNNGAGGLLRMHWRKRIALRRVYHERVWAAQIHPHVGPVRLELIRYSTGRQMDYDNLVSTGKTVIDAIVRAGVLPDDNPAVIAERRYTQERAASKEAQRTVIRITDL